MFNKFNNISIRECEDFSLHNLKQGIWYDFICRDRIYIVKQNEYSKLEEYGMLKLISEQCKNNLNCDYEIYVSKAKYDNYRIIANVDYSYPYNIIKNIEQLNYNLTIEDCNILKDKDKKYNVAYLDDKSDIIAIKINRIDRTKKSKLWNLLHKNNIKIYDFISDDKSLVINSY